jgi:predicted MPP superfamily phosphohydrolase
MLRFLIPALLLLAIDFYFFQAVKQLSSGFEPRWRMVAYGAYWTASVVALGMMVVGAQAQNMPSYVRYYLLSGIMVLTFPKVLGILFLLGEDITRVGGGVIRAVQGSDTPFLADRRSFVAKASIITAAIPFSAMLYGMARTAFDYTIKKKTLVFPNLPEAFNGLKVVQISDMHSGSFASVDHVRKAFDLILEQKADMIFFTGDMVNNLASEVEPFKEELARLKAPLGVYSILGNHDYGDYGQWPNEADKRANLQRLMAIQRGAGWNLLMDEHRILERDGQQMAVVGIQNWGASLRFPKYGDMNKATKGTDRVPFKILLSHDPSHWDAQVLTEHKSIDLTLSGHTHGFQFGIEIPGFKWSPVQYVYKQWAGLYQEGAQYLYVNRGLGFLGFMGRVGIPPEITVLELKRGTAAVS